mmetsp:Transcript_240/g.317  ORF Transcript_240/g.317 Transcript_240/m.317 type:complete len:523 (-) Transcript_240:14-1582(-)
MSMSGSESKSELEEQKSILFRKFKQYNQEHVFEYWPTLADDQKQILIHQLSSIPIEHLNDYLQSATQEQHTLSTTTQTSTEEVAAVQPFSGKVTSTINQSHTSFLQTKCHALGIQAIQSNTVATVLLAGGQGTRLGYDGPKGMYNLNQNQANTNKKQDKSNSEKTLFQLIAQRILKLTQIAANNNDEDTKTKHEEIHIPLYIMTSPMNHEITKQYFETNQYFGLNPDDVYFFSQGVLPCLSLSSGKILMETKFKCAMAPDGNGGIYNAMSSNGIFTNMTKRNIQHVHIFAIDNALVKPADPTFIGYCMEQNADCGNKVVWKSEAHEKVGVIAEKFGKPCVIEYSELSSEMAEATSTTSSTKLVYGAANICNHYYTLSFLTDVILPNQGKMYHIATKKIPTLDNEKPNQNNGVKLESFIFDVFPLSTKMAILEVDREDEFAPVKNAPGLQLSDSPDTANEKMSVLAMKWLKDVGAILLQDNDNDDNGGKDGDLLLCEMNPLTSYGGEGLEKYKGQVIKCPFRL